MKTETSASRRTFLCGALATVLVLLTASGGPQALTAGVPGAARPAGGWSGLWLSTDSTAAAGTTLKDVRTIIGADTGKAAALTGKGVGVALLDTGVAPVPGIPASQVVNGPDLSYESQSDTLRYLDTYGHGTHLAGIIVANDTATGTHGLAPGVKLTSVKVGSASGAADVTQMVAAIDWVVQHRNDDPSNPIRVINMSYGSGGHPAEWNDPLQAACDIAWQAGIVVVAAAGNSGASKLDNPANDPRLIEVGAVSPNGTLATADDTLTSYTNVDPTRGLVLAPGQSIPSLRVPGSNIDTAYQTARVGDTLFKGSGTSQAAAIVTAAAALLLQYRPSLTADQVKKFIGLGASYQPKASPYGSEVNVNGAITIADQQPTNNGSQGLPLSSGTGLIETARGGSHAVSDKVNLTGEKSPFGTWSSSAWATKAFKQQAWSGGTWMGWRLAGDGWTGTSYASKTWAAATWSGGSWGGNTKTWTDTSWTGRYWSGRYWSTGTWSGRYWSSDDWEAAYWG